MHDIEYRIIGQQRQIGPDIELEKEEDEENQYFVIQSNISILLYHTIPLPD